MIERTTSGLIDYCLDQVENLDSMDDIDLEKRVRFSLSYIKEVRSLGTLELQYKQLVAKSPEIAKNRALTMNVGSNGERKKIGAE